MSFLLERQWFLHVNWVRPDILKKRRENPRDGGADGSYSLPPRIKLELQLKKKEKSNKFSSLA